MSDFAERLDSRALTADPVYCLADLVRGLRQTGLESGDVVFFHVAHLALGRADRGVSSREICEFLYSAMREAVGPNGTILLPAFSLSFQRNEPFDAQSTPCIAGPWSSSLEFLEYFRLRPEVIRSIDPILSVAGVGPHAEQLLTHLPNSSLGKDCFFERLTKSKGKLCGIGVGLWDSPFLDFLEEDAHDLFRYKKLSTGYLGRNGTQTKCGWISSVPKHDVDRGSRHSQIAAAACSQGLCRVSRVGSGEVFSVDCSVLHEWARRKVALWIPAAGPGEPSDTETTGANRRLAPVALPESTSMEEMIAALWKLPRDIVSDGYDTALQAIATCLPMTIHQYPTGTECWTWLVPEKWTCHEAWLETLDGRRLFSYNDNPLHVVSYSLPIDREVSREELLDHLYTHPRLHDAIPFIFKYYERDWGLCCSQRLKESLRDTRYRVVIKTDFTYGTLKVGEAIARGRSSDTIVLCAHLCHPAMVNDDLSGVVVGVNVMQELLKRPDLRYTYRLLILPETIGSVAYLSHHEELIPNMKGGLFLEMLGLDNPHALQLSWAGDTEMDVSMTQVLREIDTSGWVGAFRTVVGNDERQFNAPGVRVPMLSLSRVLSKDSGTLYYPEYHSSQDNPQLVAPGRLEESRDLVLKMIDRIEHDRTPVNRYRGEVFCSRYGLHIDAYSNPEGNRALFDILFLIDGTKSISEIARACNISFQSARVVVDKLYELGLVEYKHS